MTSYAFTVPIRTVSEMNVRGSWRLRDNRGRSQKRTMELALNANMPPRKYVTLPCVVKLTRISAGTLDDDNLRSALKACRDAIARWLGVDDGKTELVRYQYEQEKCAPKTYAVRVTVLPGMRLEERVVAG
jgi:hypothetical protein